MRSAVSEMLQSQIHAQAAQRVSEQLKSWDAHARFVDLVERAVQAPAALATA